MKSYFKERCKQIYIKLAGIFFSKCQINPNKILFINFNGNGYGDNPKAICEYFRKYHPTLTLVWLSYDKKSFPTGVKVVKYGSLRSFWEQATAKVWVYNTRSFLRIPKKSSQFYVQTWHGSIGFKYLEAAANLPDRYIKDAKYDASVTDILISDSKIQTETFRKYFWYSGEIIESGLPRNDDLYNLKQKNGLRDNLKEAYHIPKDAKVVLYAPTFRDQHYTDHIKLDFESLRKSLQIGLQSDVYLLIRLHPNDNHLVQKIAYHDNIINASTYHDMQELILISDLLISDYSSAILDFILLQKPYIRFAKDLNDYQNVRGLTDLYFKLPDPLLLTEDELYHYSESILETFDLKKMKKFRDEQLGFVFDGKSCERIANIIVKKLND